jgi:hypothetical protein
LETLFRPSFDNLNLGDDDDKRVDIPEVFKLFIKTSKFNGNQTFLAIIQNILLDKENRESPDLHEMF